MIQARVKISQGRTRPKLVIGSLIVLQSESELYPLDDRVQPSCGQSRISRNRVPSMLVDRLAESSNFFPLAIGSFWERKRVEAESV